MGPGFFTTRCRKKGMKYNRGKGRSVEYIMSVPCFPSSPYVKAWVIHISTDLEGEDRALSASCEVSLDVFLQGQD